MNVCMSAIIVWIVVSFYKSTLLCFSVCFLYALLSELLYFVEVFNPSFYAVTRCSIHRLKLL